MSQNELSPSNGSGSSPDPTPQPAGPSITTPPPNEAAEPEASSRGRRSARLATRSPRRQGQSSPPPARPPNASPASSYCSAGSSIPPIEKWTVLSLRQALINSELQFSRRMNKAELYNLYVTLRSANLTPKSTAASKGANKASKARKIPDSPRSTPPLSRSRSGPSRAPARSGRPSASLGRAPEHTTARPRSSPVSAQPFTVALPAAAPNAAGPPSTSLSAPPATDNPFYFQWLPAPVTNASVRLPLLAAQATQQGISNPAPLLWPTVAETSTRLPPLATQAHTFHSFSHATNNPLSFQWPPAPVVNASVRLPPLAAEVTQPLQGVSNHTPFPWPGVAETSARLPQLATQAHSSQSFPPSSYYNLPPQISEPGPSVRLPPPTIAAPPPLPHSSLLHSKSPYSLFTATPLPVPANAVALEPPPVAHNIRAQILAGTDIDLSSLLSLIPAPESNRQMDCGDFSVTLKNQNPLSSRILSLSEFTIAFSRYIEIICSAFPHRRRELNDYLALIAELALSYGGGHFYTYHKLFSAKCAVRVSQWNQCPYWGAIDPDLHSRVFLGCRNISCAVCRSVAHSTMLCPQINPSILPCPVTSPVKSTSYVPRPATKVNPDFRRNAPSTDSRQPCHHFNIGKCARQRCRYLHICSFCGGAHARHVCPVRKSVNKKSKNYLSTPVNISHLSIELCNHPDTEFTNYLLYGLKHGFKPGVECPISESITCNNLQSALAEPDIVDNLIKKEVDSGFMIGPFDAPPFPVFRISPIGVATRKFSGKKRLIIDLSAPHNSPFPSINSLIPLDEFSLKYHDIDHAIDMLKIVGHGAWMAKIDITSAFKVMPIHPDSWHLFGVCWNGKFYFSVRLTFGCKSSPKIFDMLSEAVCWILSNNYAIPHLIHLLDDFFNNLASRCHSSSAHPFSSKSFFRARYPHCPGKNYGPCHFHRVPGDQFRLSQIPGISAQGKNRQNNSCSIHPLR